MKKVVSILLAVAMVAALLTGCGGKGSAGAGGYKIAMITDYGDITDQSFNQTTYEACKAFAEANGLEFT